MFLKKIPQSKIFKNTPRPAEISADPQIWGVVTFGPRKSAETRVRVFLALFGFLCNFVSNSTRKFRVILGLRGRNF